MEQQQHPAPSAILRGLVGYAVGTFLGIVVVLCYSINTPRYNQNRSYAILVCLSMIGSGLGELSTAIRRRSLGLDKKMDWSFLAATWTGYLLTTLVFLGSYGLSVLIGTLYQRVTGHP
jgi:hypothetical protein